MTRELPRIRSYGRYSSENYGAHTLQVDLPGLTLYFSYETVVAFNGSAYQTIVSENDWGPTTGKHLNWIDGGRKASRVPRDEFERLLKAELAQKGYSEAI